MVPRKNNSEYSEAIQTKQIRAEQLLKIQNIIGILKSRLQKVRKVYRDQLKLLQSVSLGLYEEIDKLSKKAPSEAVTDLVLTQMNEVIKETKELVTDDRYIQRLNEFVPAGDNPQYRDAVVVMRQVRQGLERFDQHLDRLVKQLTGYLMNTQSIEMALQLYLAGSTSVSEDDLTIHNQKTSEEWLIGKYPRVFDFNKLDKINITDYFEVSDE